MTCQEINELEDLQEADMRQWRTYTEAVSIFLSKGRACLHYIQLLYRSSDYTFDSKCTKLNAISAGIRNKQSFLRRYINYRI